MMQNGRITHRLGVRVDALSIAEQQHQCRPHRTMAAGPTGLTPFRPDTKICYMTLAARGGKVRRL